VGEVNDTTSVEEEDYEDSGDKTELETGFSESDFNEYLQGCAEMLEEERQGTFEEGNELY
ncbi:3710_t:CDS:1, partial [Paraglomus occultum]